MTKEQQNEVNGICKGPGAGPSNGKSMRKSSYEEVDVALQWCNRK
jgi:hypothetical protein